MTRTRPLNAPALPLLPLLMLLGLTAGLAWTFATTLEGLAQRWANDPQYAHGWLVPLLALALLWSRRARLRSAALRPSWWGIGLLTLGMALRGLGTYVYFDWLDALAVIPCLAGLCVAAGGWPALRWSWPGLVFLVFMIPLPYRAEVALAHPLQRLATLASTYALQTLGLPALADGNVILLNDLELGIVEACSGLRMLMIFFALSTAAFFLARRSFAERLILLASAIPIALSANVLRITLTAILHETAGSALANAVFHDLAGWFMMPIGLALLGLELLILARLFVTPPAAATFATPGRSESPPRRPRPHPTTARPAAALVSAGGSGP